MKELSYWTIGADMGGVSYKQDAFTKYERVVLVLGSEGKGLSQLVRISYRNA